MGEDLDSHAAEQNSGDPVPAVRGHDDQVAVLVVRGINNLY